MRFLMSAIVQPMTVGHRLTLGHGWPSLDPLAATHLPSDVTVLRSSSTTVFHPASAANVQPESPISFYLVVVLGQFPPPGFRAGFLFTLH
jgi:hypothetical protein